MWFSPPWSRFPDAGEFDAGRKRRRRRFWMLAALAVAGLASLWPAWRWWRYRLVEQGLVQAEVYMAREEWHPAELLLDQNLAEHPRDPRVLRTLARLLDRIERPDALIHRHTLNLLDPANDADWIATALTAIRFGNWPAARVALASASAPAQAGPDWLRAAAALDLGTRDQPALVRHLAALHQLVPADIRVELNLQLARVDDPAAAVYLDARTQLGRMARGPDHRITATLALITSGQRRDAPESLARIARRIFPSLTFGEQEARVALIEHMKQQPAPEVEEVVRLLRHLAEQKRAAEARRWLAELPPALRNAPLVLDAEAGLCADLADWPALRQVIGRGGWGGGSPHVLDAAFGAQAAFARGETGEQLRQWKLALTYGENDTHACDLLVRLAVLWEWPDKARQALRTALVTNAVSPATLARLVRLAALAGDTQTLAQALEQWHRAEPKFPELTDRRLYIGALLGNLEANERDELAASPPKTAPFQLAAQGLLALRGPTTAARIEALAAAPRNAKAPVEVRLVHGLLLQRAGRQAAAEPELESVRRETLLPEERALLAAAGR